MSEQVQVDKSCPIDSKIGAVFVPVTNMNYSVNWYKKLLGHPLDPKFADHEKSEERTVYSIHLGETTLLLDSMNRDELKASPNHLFFFSTKDILKSFQHLVELQIEIVNPKENEITKDSRVIVIKDPDGNRIMIHREG
ncbi:VOC family protein [Paenibacillus eucommiae]|uniref:Enzyme related to lactoylglutathione lyase n=1 Tax=Paenibacillus eucommiae TaxID=1355755 RepID=A0ABS4JB10_9BACL|nr:VOC family protein [Paenibacillus eucommiae]MBP1997033.1 putative enzyme related to lactoylglutathione lyase [Paenibacillus eucommiae]